MYHIFFWQLFPVVYEIKYFYPTVSKESNVFYCIDIIFYDIGNYLTA